MPGNPMKVGINLKSKGIRETTNRLDFISLSFEDTRSVMAEMVVLIAAMNKRNFGRGPELAAKTLSDKARMGFPAAKLVRTGALKEGMTTATGGGYGIREISRSTLIFGSTAWYGIFAKSGTPKEPKRYVMASEKAVNIMARKLILEHINQPSLTPQAWGARALGRMQGPTP